MAIWVLSSKGSYCTLFCKFLCKINEDGRFYFQILKSNREDSN